MNKTKYHQKEVKSKILQVYLLPIGWESFDHVAIDHQPLTVLNSGKTLGTGRSK